MAKVGFSLLLRGAGRVGREMSIRCTSKSDSHCESQHWMQVSLEMAKHRMQVSHEGNSMAVDCLWSYIKVLNRHDINMGSEPLPESQTASDFWQTEHILTV
jgi:beta-galactosidase/beta-glucuronidase